MVISLLIDQIGSWSFSVVLAVYVFDRTGSVSWIAAVSASRWVTGLLISGYGGVVADRFERTRVMWISALSSAAVMTAMSVIVGTNAPLLSLLAVSALGTVVASPYSPAAGALTPQIVPEDRLAAANALFSVIENLVIVVGPGIGGLLLLTGKPVVGIAVNAGSFLVAAELVRHLNVRSTGGGGTGGESATTQLVAGVRVLARHRVAIVLVAFGGLADAIYGASTVIFVPLSLQLGSGVTGYSYLIAGSSLGAVLAAGLANRLSGSARLTPVILISLATTALPFLASVWVHSPVIALALQAISGAGMVTITILSMTAVQRDLPGDVLSRALGAVDVVSFAATVLGSFGASLLFARAGLHATLVTIGVAFPLLALLGWPALRRADRHSAQIVEALMPRVALLSTLDMFSGVDRAALERLAASADEQFLPSDHVVIRQGDVADAMWILVSGALSVRVTDNRGFIRQLPPVTAPGYVGEIGLLHAVTRTASVFTTVPSTVLRIEATSFRNVLEAAPASQSMVTLAGTRMARTPLLPGGAR
jgi:MFS family permease